MPFQDRASYATILKRRMVCFPSQGPHFWGPNLLGSKKPTCLNGMRSISAPAWQFCCVEKEKKGQQAWACAVDYSWVTVPNHTSVSRLFVVDSKTLNYDSPNNSVTCGRNEVGNLVHPLNWIKRALFSIFFGHNNCLLWSPSPLFNGGEPASQINLH